MRAGAAICVVATVFAISSFSADPGAGKTKATTGTIDYAYLDMHLRWQFVKGTSGQAGFERQYSAELRVCYAQQDGCRWESFRETLSVHETQRDPIGPSNVSEWMAASEKLTTRAMTKLGEAGWELIGQSQTPTFFNAPDAVGVFWFKRTRASGQP